MPGEYILETIAAEFGRLVSTVCRKMIQNEEVAREAAQEVWLEIARSLKNFRGESKISTWIFAITKRVALKYAVNERTHSTRFLSGYFRRDEEIEIPVASDVEKDIWIRQMCDSCLTGMLHCLENDVRLAYLLRDIAGLSYHEIAVIMERKEPAIRQIVARSRNRLRNFLNNECCLYAPEGRCNCRMKKHVMEIDLPGEYRKLRKTAKVADFLKASGRVLLERNFWENIAGTVTKPSATLTNGIKKQKSHYEVRKCVTKKV